ncbi:MAG: TonB family protein [Janthinobacterium lividum]
MNKLTYLLLLAGALRAEMSAAQQVAPPLKTEYLDANFTALPSATGARYRRETEYCDSVGGTIRQYYANGQRYSTAAYEHILKNIAHGTFESWHPNGQLAAHEDYTHGQLAGERRLYFDSGQLKRYEQYQDGQRTAGECYTEQGQPIAFSEYEVLPVYPEGLGDERAIVAAISRSIHYPQDALAAGVQGQVFVKFIVTKDGQVNDVEVVKSVLPSLDAETVRAVQQLRPFKPGAQDGQPAVFSFTVPVSYNIAPSRTLVDDRSVRKHPK